MATLSEGIDCRRFCFGRPELAHLVIIKFYMFVTQSHPDIEAGLIAVRFPTKCGDVAFVHSVVGIRHFGDIGCKDVGSACTGIFFARL